MQSRRWVREPEARAYMGGISHGAFYGLMRDGLVRPIKVGRSSFFDLYEIDRLMERLRQEQYGESLPTRATS